MAYSYFDYEGTGTTIQTNILCVSTEHMYAFKVLSKDKYTVTISKEPLPAKFTKTDAGVLCELSTAPSTKIRVIRSTPYDVLMHDFSNGAQFNADSVDEVYEQLLYLCQEIVEGKLLIDSSGIIGTSACISQAALDDKVAAGKAAGYDEGYDAGYTVGSSIIHPPGGGGGTGGGGGYLTDANGHLTDANGKRIYPVVIAFAEYYNPPPIDTPINSYGIAYTYIENYKGSGQAMRYYSYPDTVHIVMPDIIGGVIPYTFKDDRNRSVAAVVIS